MHNSATDRQIDIDTPQYLPLLVFFGGNRSQLQLNPDHEGDPTRIPRCTAPVDLTDRVPVQWEKEKEKEKKKELIIPHHTQPRGGNGSLPKFFAGKETLLAGMGWDGMDGMR